MTKRVLSLLICAVVSVTNGCRERHAPQIVIQLNWLHDPTFVAEYLYADSQPARVTVREGGPNISSISAVLTGRATAAVVGADIFLETLDKEIEEHGRGEIVCVAVDLQRNPVGWVMHPDAARRAGLNDQVGHDPARLNQWLFDQVARKRIRVGDKRGTETTAIWVAWRKAHKLPEAIKVVPVGFDASVVLAAPNLVYPVYLNEEPFRLATTVGQPMVVFDPAADGIHLYGNVIVMRRALADSAPGVVRDIQSGLSNAWGRARSDLAGARARVARFYTGVPDTVLAAQLRQTIEFAFYDAATAGGMDTTTAGRWAVTLRALQESGLVGTRLTFETLKKYLVPPELPRI